jgi:hypothetical protein
MRCAEDYVRYACRWLLDHCRCLSSSGALASQCTAPLHQMPHNKPPAHMCPAICTCAAWLKLAATFFANLVQG